MNELIPSPLDRSFAEFLASRSGFVGHGRERFATLVATVSAALAAGHSCLPLSLEEEAFLKSCSLVSSGSATPLVIERRRLYLQRYAWYERRLAGELRQLARVTQPVAIDAGLFAQLFPAAAEQTGGQERAAQLALDRPLAIICGGPGTGKTTTVVKILALLLATPTANGGKPAIALAAPTGKAAMRLGEAIGGSQVLPLLPEAVRAAIPAGATTLHRLLGVRRSSPRFRHHRDNPLPYDMVVVDEASMVDLALMSKLVDALRPGTRLILLGDKDQLASVESGAVLGDLLASLPQNTIELTRTFRFNQQIKDLATAINRADGDAAWQLLHGAAATGVGVLGDDFPALIGARYGEYLAAAHRPEVDPHALFAMLNGFRVLCAVHHGPQGVEGINGRVEQLFARRGYAIRPQSWYTGRPVLICRNDYQLDLFNGDIGICLPDRHSGEMRVWFERPDGGLHGYSPHRLPTCETVFAMTIHKSQGSEFAEVVVVLPREDSRILGRQLLYTAVTRARRQVWFVATEHIFRLTLSRSLTRHSGLADRLDGSGLIPDRQ